MLFPVSFLETVDLSGLPGLPSLESYQAYLSTKSFESYFEGLEDILEFRDVAEDLLEHYGVQTNFTVPKSEYGFALACSQQVNLLLKSAPKESLQYTDFALQKVSRDYYELSDPLLTLRPRLRTSISDLEPLLREMESVLSSFTAEHLQRWTKTTQNTTVSLLSVLYCLLIGIDVDDAFVNCPKTMIRGNQCTLRDATTASGSIKSCKRQTADLEHLIVLADGSFSVRTKESWKTIPEAHCQLGVLVPGAILSVNNALRVYAIFAKDTTACVYAITFGDMVTVQKKLELDLQEDKPIDFLDCQRDRDNQIVLLWGHRNHLTGYAEQNFFAWTEDEFLSKRMNLTPTDTHKLPNRIAWTTKIDYRDHGNLLALVTSTTESEHEGRRAFTMQNQVFFGNTILKPVDPSVVGVYGSPLEFYTLKATGLYKDETCVVPIALKKTLSILVPFI
jgi:hypothetical protein